MAWHGASKSVPSVVLLHVFAGRAGQAPFPSNVSASTPTAPCMLLQHLLLLINDVLELHAKMQVLHLVLDHAMAL